MTLPKTFPPLSCPHLGLKNDPVTSLGYPSTGNYCHQCRPYTFPNFQHQEDYCLSVTHVDCPVYNQAPGQNFPAELKAETVSVARIAKPRKLRFFMFGAVLGIFVLWMIIVAFQSGKFGMNVFAHPTELLPTFAAEATSTSMLPLVVPIETIVIPSVTPVPTQTLPPTPTLVPQQKHALETPILVGNRQLLIHLALNGEGFDYLGKTYNTTGEVIRAINFLHAPNVWANMPIIISPGLIVVDPDMPSFEAYKVVDIKISIDQLAKKLNIDGTLLRQYNACLNGCNLVKGDWVILPHSN